MFEFIRTHRRWMQLILLLLIVPSFVFVGAQGYDTFVSNEPEVAVVGETPITASEFERVRLNQLDQMRQNMGAQFDVAMADTPQTRQRLLNDLINQRLMETVARDNRFSCPTRRCATRLPPFLLCRTRASSRPSAIAKCWPLKV